MAIKWTRPLLALATAVAAGSWGAGAQSAPPVGEWRYIGGDAQHTRFSPLDQITADNVATLEVAWTWRGDNFGPTADPILRSTPLYVDGLLYTVAGERRSVAAIDPETGETIWTYREPHTTRWLRGMRNNYGKGVAFAEVAGRAVIFYTSPAFFLHAIDAKSGEHLENWGTRVPLPGFPRSGVIDMLPDLVKDWEPWLTSGYKYDPDHGIPSDPKNGARIPEIGRVKIDIAYGGSCTAGKRDDIDMYARVMADAERAGKRVADGVKFYLQFGSQDVEAYAKARGYTELFARTGVQVIKPGCGACIGCGPGVSDRGDQVTVSAINRNYKGRSGPGRLYLASPLTVAASAVSGEIVEYEDGMFAPRK